MRRSEQPQFEELKKPSYLNHYENGKDRKQITQMYGFVGETSVGKSSLINVLLGTNLKTGIGGVTEEEQEVSAKRTPHAIYDTPALPSQFANTHADPTVFEKALNYDTLFVLFQSSLKGVERFVRLAAGRGKKMFFVRTKCDLFSLNDRKGLKQELVGDRLLLESWGIAKPTIFTSSIYTNSEQTYDNAQIKALLLDKRNEIKTSANGLPIERAQIKQTSDKPISNQYKSSHNDEYKILMQRFTQQLPLRLSELLTSAKAAYQNKALCRNGYPIQSQKQHNWRYLIRDLENNHFQYYSFICMPNFLMPFLIGFTSFHEQLFSSLKQFAYVHQSNLEGTNLKMYLEKNGEKRQDMENKLRITKKEQEKEKNQKRVFEGQRQRQLQLAKYKNDLIEADSCYQLQKRYGFVGETSVGKSSLINVLLGTHLATGLGGVTEEEQEVSVKGTPHVVYDTPALPSQSVFAHSDYSAFEKALNYDTLFVLFESSLKCVERFVRLAAGREKKMFFVRTKCDLFSVNDRKTLTEELVVDRLLLESWGITKPTIFTSSANSNAEWLYDNNKIREILTSKAKPILQPLRHGDIYHQQNKSLSVDNRLALLRSYDQQTCKYRNNNSSIPKNSRQFVKTIKEEQEPTELVSTNYRKTTGRYPECQKDFAQNKIDRFNNNSGQVNKPQSFPHNNRHTDAICPQINSNQDAIIQQRKRVARIFQSKHPPRNMQSPSKILILRPNK